MKEVKLEELRRINGGYISGAIFTGIANIIKYINQIGIGLGSAIRRSREGNLCPLK